MTKRIFTGCVMILACPMVGAAQSLGPVDLVLSQVEDSSSYVVLRYSVGNPSSSAWGLAALQVDVGASAGTPTALPATGTFLDQTTGTAAQPLEPYAQVGPIAPGSWRAALERTGHVRWFSANDGYVSTDSVAPGTSASGFGLRTTYLPGLSEVLGLPTRQSCCSVADTLTHEFPRQGEFSVASTTVSPRYTPTEVTIDLLQTQLTAICDDPLWLDDTTLCGEFEDLLDMAESDEDDENFYGVATVLDHLNERVEEEESSFDSSNGYWLLLLNSAQARDNALTAATAAADRWHFRTDANTVIVPNGHSLSGTSQAGGSVYASLPGGEETTLVFAKTVESASAFVDGVWSVQIDFMEITANYSELLLKDVAVHRYASNGTLIETQYVASGTVTSLEAGGARISLSADLDGWSGGSASDLLALSFVIENTHSTEAEWWAVRVGITYGDWGGSWMSQPK